MSTRLLKSYLVILLWLSLSPVVPLCAEWVDVDGVGQGQVTVYLGGACGSTPGQALCLGGLSAPYIAWREGTDIFYLEWDGTTWVDADGVGQGEIKVLDTALTSETAWLCLDSSGNPHVAWTDSTPGNMEVFYLSWDGTSWVDADGVGQGQVNVSNDSTLSRWPALQLDSSGNPHIAWCSSGPANDIYYLKWDGSAWVDADGVGQGDINVSSGFAGDSYQPSLRLDNLDRPHIAWLDDTSGNPQILQEYQNIPVCQYI